ncbi:MAG TPA: S53 family peptidase [Blastocatellia bacterium]
MKQSGKRSGVAGPRPRWVVLFSVIVLLGAQALPRLRARAQGQLVQLPTRHVHQEVSGGETPFVNPLPADQSLDLDITLPLRNAAALDDLLQELYDPQNPLFHQFLSVEQFTEQFGPTEEDYAAVVSFAQESGLTVTATSYNRFLLSVTGPVANIETAFNVKMGSYYDPVGQRTFYSADREPSADLAVGLWHISGLDNFSIPHPASLKKADDVKGKFGAGPGGSYLGSDMRAAYYGVTGSAALTGAGQSVGLFEFGGYNIADVNTYFESIGQSLNVQVLGVSTDGSKLSCTGRCDDTEQVIDIQQAVSMAPAMNSALVYVARNSDVKLFNRMATDNIAKSLSCSWGWDPPDPSSDDPIFQEFAAQGQTLFVATGDDGAFTKKSQGVYPADDDYVIAVGGTDLNTTGPGGAWLSETGWKDSSGGPSPDKISIPSYQTAAGVITAANQASKKLRNCPDVAAEANLDNYICSDGTCGGGWGGTSFAAPRWAGYLALVNEQSAANGQGPAGFINPAIYSIALGPNYHADFHDITKGNNQKYSAEKGFDLVTGWGSPNGTGLINELAP